MSGLGARLQPEDPSDWGSAHPVTPSLLAEAFDQHSQPNETHESAELVLDRRA
jgi:hypothetical protein